MIEWLFGLPGGMRPEPLNLPKGHWVVCGTGSFSQYFLSALESAGVTCSVVQVDPQKQGESVAALRAT